MNKLILNENVTMSSRDLLDVINNVREQEGENSIRSNDFHARVADELSDFNYESFVVQNLNKTESVVFKLTKDMCMLVAMRESKKVRRMVLAKLNGIFLNVPQTLPDALRLAADLVEANNKQKLIIEQQKPAVDFVDNYVKAEGNYNFRQVAKLLNAKEPELKLFLIENGIIYYTGKTMTPYQKHIDAGRFVVKTGVSDTEHAYTQMKFTPKGFNWISELWANRLGEVA